MPISNDDKHTRRDEWFLKHGPCRHCGSWIRLEVDHIDPTTKSRNIDWGMSLENRLKELIKCQALCYKCHKIKTGQERAKGHIGLRRGCKCRECIKLKKTYDHERNKKV